MKTSNTGRQLIEQFEGLILSAYDDANDKIVKPGQDYKGTLTIGYGHTSSAGAPRVTIGQTITKEKADQILASDLSKVEAQVSSLVKVPLNQNQFDALVSFQFNTGALSRSTSLKLLNKKDYAGAAQALLAYNRGNGQVLAGLTRRRKAEKDLFLKTPSVAPTVAAGALITAGGASVASQTHNYEHWLYIGLGTAAVLLTVYILVKLYKGYKNGS